MNKIQRQKSRDYTTISNVFLRDERLSLKAKGFLAVIMGLPDDWEFTIRGICAILKEGRTAVYSTINELKEAGYCKVTNYRNETGQIDGNDYTFSENPDAGQPYSENLHTDNQPQLNIYRINKEIDKINNECETSIKPIKPKLKRFVKPTIEEVREYCLSRHNNVDPVKFWNFYEAKGWKIGNNQMKNWKACVVTWEGRPNYRVSSRPTQQQEDIEKLLKFPSMAMQEE